MVSERLRRWSVTINAGPTYTVAAPTAADASVTAGDLWRAEHTPETPQESGGGIWQVDTHKLADDDGDDR